jgi:hypothetical protein
MNKLLVIVFLVVVLAFVINAGVIAGLELQLGLGVVNQLPLP